MEIHGDDSGDVAPEVMRGPAGAVAVGGGAGVANLFTELDIGVSDHIPHVLPAPHFPAVAQLLRAHSQFKAPDLA